MRREALFQGLTRAVQTHSRVIGGQTQLECHVADPGALEDDASQNSRILGLDVLGLREHTPAVDTVILGRGELDLVDGKHHIGPLAKLIDHHVTRDLPDPGLGPSEITQLVRLRQGALERDLENLFRVHPRASALPNQGQEWTPLGAKRIANGLGGRHAGLDVHSPRVCSQASITSTFEELKDLAGLFPGTPPTGTAADRLATGWAPPCSSAEPTSARPL
jgi:hypothetical protein